jgi:triacylglycerol lipase
MKTKLLKVFAATTVLGSSCAHKTPIAPAAHVRRVVLVHGFLDNGITFGLLKRRLERRGIECYVPRLKHVDGRGGLEACAVKLKQDIDGKFGISEPISMIGFSMGGLVTREYLQHQGGAARCERLITISSPHHGTHAAWLYPSQGVVQMRPGSPFLTQLQRTENELAHIPITSYRTPLDLLILPASSSIWDRAVNLEFPVLLHPLMLSSRAVLDDVEHRLAR